MTCFNDYICQAKRSAIFSCGVCGAETIEVIRMLVMVSKLASNDLFCLLNRYHVLTSLLWPRPVGVVEIGTWLHLGTKTLVFSIVADCPWTQKPSNRFLQRSRTPLFPLCVVNLHVSELHMVTTFTYQCTTHTQHVLKDVESRFFTDLDHPLCCSLSIIIDVVAIL